MPDLANKKIAESIDLSGMPASERIACWNEVISANFAPADNRSNVPASEFNARLQRSDLGKASFCRVNASPILSIRDSNMLRRKPLDDFFLSYLMEGESVVSQNGRQAVQRAGEFLLYDGDRPLAYNGLSRCVGIWVRLPRHVVKSRFANAEALTARSVPNTTPLGALTSSFLIGAANLTLDADSPAAARVLSSLIDLIAATFEATSGAALGCSHRANLLDIAKEHILANISDTDLNSAAIAYATGVSRRTLNRLFAAEGTTPGRWIWRKRLERSRVVLESRSEMRIIDVAANCGFTDAAHFSRLFKLEYGVPPKSISGRISHL